MNILFVCRHNRFRSVMAEGLFRKYNTNKSLKIKSAGPIMGKPVGPAMREVAREFGIKIKQTPTGLSTDILDEQDIIVIVADDVPASLFDKSKKQGTKIIVWRIPDRKTHKVKEMSNITKRIEDKVIALAKELA